MFKILNCFSNESGNMIAISHNFKENAQFILSLNSLKPSTWFS